MRLVLIAPIVDDVFRILQLATRASASSHAPAPLLFNLRHLHVCGVYWHAFFHIRLRYFHVGFLINPLPGESAPPRDVDGIGGDRISGRPTRRGGARIKPLLNCAMTAFVASSAFRGPQRRTRSSVRCELFSAAAKRRGGADGTVHASKTSAPSAPTEEPRKGQIKKASAASGPSQRQRRLKSQRSKQALNEEFGRVGCYCTCEEFSFDQVTDFLLAEPAAEVLTFDDSIHFRLAERMEESVFIFPYGAVVIWGMDAASEQLVLRELRPFQLEPFAEPEADEFRYVYHESPGITNEAMTLTRGADPQDTLRERLALSHALAQSVKLATFEQSVQNTIAETRHLPTELATYGKITASRTDVSKNVGRLFVDRHNVYLYSDVLDTPDYFWDYETYEWLYAAAARYLELTHRTEWLFRRLDMVRELYDLLGQELQFKHSSDLEMVIIGLITFEIILTLAHDWVEAIAGGALGARAGSIVGILFLTIGIGMLIGLFLAKQWQRHRQNRQKRFTMRR